MGKHGSDHRPADRHATLVGAGFIPAPFFNSGRMCFALRTQGIRLTCKIVSNALSFI
jgi:hypothetical protein